MPIDEATKSNKRFEIEATVTVVVCTPTEEEAERKACDLLATVAQDVTIN